MPKKTVLAGISSAILVLGMIVAFPVAHASFHTEGKYTAGKVEWSPGSIPEIGTLYVIKLSGSVSIIGKDVVEPASAHLFLNITAVKTSGIPNVSLAVIDGNVTIGDNTYLLNEGRTTLQPVSNVNINVHSEGKAKILTVFASMEGATALPKSPSDPIVRLGPAIKREAATVQIGNVVWIFNHFSGTMRVPTYEEAGKVSVSTPGPFVDKVGLSDTDTVDAFGSRIQQLFVGQQMLLQSVLANNQEVPQDFVYIMRVTDSEGFTVQLSWIQGILRPEQSFTVAQSWLPEDGGVFTVQILVWESMTNPVPLRSSIESLQLIVSN